MQALDGMPRTLILDLDGTLIDSAADLGAALNRLMAARDLAPFTRRLSWR